MTFQRFDRVQIKAHETEDGFLFDSPIVGRTGVQIYAREDGTKYGELRLPEDVFDAHALASMRGKPISIDHAEGQVTGNNAKRLAIGTVISEGRQDGTNVVTDIVIHSPKDIGNRRELSLGYNCDLDYISGEFEGQKYDAIQRNIRVNHLSVVKKGRAGVAKLNMDGHEVVDDEVIINQKEQHTMTVKVKLDNGLEYDAAPEVSAELTKLRVDASDSAKKLEAIPALQAKIDGLQAKVDGLDELVKKAKADGKVEALARLTLEATADKFKVDHKDKADREVKELVIKSVRKDADLAEKSDAYVDAAFDLAVETKTDANMADQRATVNTKVDGVKQVSAKQAHADYLEHLKNKGDK